MDDLFAEFLPADVCRRDAQEKSPKLAAGQVSWPRRTVLDNQNVRLAVSLCATLVEDHHTAPVSGKVQAYTLES
ncbi:hypothetical protein GN244_ATG08322 [Phytophthora infestans]|uniref:Uncharacterized protein n=1 Tax=Phytophthora infestans TaxID=4787 RepID=A0A833TEB6_PHYIN|nr:hypothetical protein GN244_ATG08322 [Phytophthora infestans]